MAMKLAELAHLVGGKLVGDGDLEITGAATIRDACPGDITLADGTRFLGPLAACAATAAVVPEDLVVAGKSVIGVTNVPAAFHKIVAALQPGTQSHFQGIDPAAQIAPSARLAGDVTVFGHASIGEQVEIGEGSVIHAGVRILAGCRIGRNVTIFPNAVLYENTVVGDRCLIHANAVLGAYGFGYQTIQGRHELSSQLGHVQIGNDVEVGACTTIDRGTYGPTVIGEGTKIDNQVMIAHNCRIGRHNLICSQVGIAGSCTTGDYVVLAGQVGIRDHVAIGDRATLGAKSGVMRDIPADATYLGIPATPERDQMHIMASIAKLPDLRRQVRALEQQVAALATAGARSRQDAA